MSQILCVIDFSESAAKVWEVAARIACACRAHLIVLFPYRLIDYSHPGGDGPSLKVKLETEARDRFRALKENTKGMEGVSCEFHLEIGFLTDRINAHVKRNNIDMIIIGQHHTSPASDFRGINMQTVMSDSKIPFVIVPADVKKETQV